MATIQREKVYEEILVKDQWAITKACCDKLQTIGAGWGFCPFCGEKIIEADTVVDSIPSAEKAEAMEGK